MRRVLVDYARQHNAERRAGGLQRVEMEDNLALSPERLDEVLFLDSALAKAKREESSTVGAGWSSSSILAAFQWSRLLQLSTRRPCPVKRDWSLARMFLYRELNPGAVLPEAETGEENWFARKDKPRKIGRKNNSSAGVAPFSRPRRTPK